MYEAHLLHGVGFFALKMRCVERAFQAVRISRICTGKMPVPQSFALTGCGRLN